MADELGQCRAALDYYGNQCSRKATTTKVLERGFLSDKWREEVPLCTQHGNAKYGVGVADTQAERELKSAQSALPSQERRIERLTRDLQDEQRLLDSTRSRIAQLEQQVQQERKVVTDASP